MIFASDGIVAEICEALGLKDVIDVDICMHLGDTATITVKSFASKNDIKKIIPILTKYELRPIEKSLGVEEAEPEDGYKTYKIKETK